MKASNNLVHFSVISLLVICIGTIFFFFFFYRPAEPGNMLNGTGIAYILLRYIAFYSTILLLILRFLIFKKLRTSFVYLFSAILNLFIGLLAVYLFFFHHYTRDWLHLCILNCLLGSVIFIDIFWIKPLHNF